MTTETMQKFLTASDELDVLANEASFMLDDKGFENMHMHEVSQLDIDNDPELSELNERMNVILDMFRDAERELAERFSSPVF